MDRRKNRQSSVANGRAECPREFHRVKLALLSEKRRHHLFIFAPAQGTRCVHEPSAGTDIPAELMQKRALFFRRLDNLRFS